MLCFQAFHIMAVWRCDSVCSHYWGVFKLFVDSKAGISNRGQGKLLVIIRSILCSIAVMEAHKRKLKVLFRRTNKLRVSVPDICSHDFSWIFFKERRSWASLRNKPLLVTQLHRNINQVPASENFCKPMYTAKQISEQRSTETDSKATANIPAKIQRHAQMCPRPAFFERNTSLQAVGSRLDDHHDKKIKPVSAVTPSHDHCLPYSIEQRGLIHEGFGREHTFVPSRQLSKSSSKQVSLGKVNPS